MDVRGIAAISCGVFNCTASRADLCLHLSLGWYWYIAISAVYDLSTILISRLLLAHTSEITMLLTVSNAKSTSPNISTDKTIITSTSTSLRYEIKDVALIADKIALYRCTDTSTGPVGGGGAGEGAWQEVAIGSVALHSFRSDVVKVREGEKLKLEKQPLYSFGSRAMGGEKFYTWVNTMGVGGPGGRGVDAVVSSGPILPSLRMNTHRYAAASTNVSYGRGKVQKTARRHIRTRDRDHRSLHHTQFKFSRRAVYLGFLFGGTRVGGVEGGYD